MAKIDERIEQRLVRIKQLENEREKINAELAKLLGLAEPETNKAFDPMPKSFKLSAKIIEILDELGRPMKIIDVVKEIEKRDSLNLDRKIVQSSMNYLAKKGNLVKDENRRGVFSRPQTTSNVTADDAPETDQQVPQ